MFNKHSSNFKHFKGGYSKATETCRMLNPNKSQSNAQLELPQEVSDTTSQLLTLFRCEVKKCGSSPEPFKRCLALKASSKRVTLRFFFLCSFYLDSCSTGAVRAVEMSGFVGSVTDYAHTTLFAVWPPQPPCLTQLEAAKLPWVLHLPPACTNLPLLGLLLAAAVPHKSQNWLSFTGQT